MNIELFATDEVVEQTEADLANAQGGARVKLLINLAWHLRQRDTTRSLALADEVKNLLAEADLPESERKLIALRLILLQAEERWLFGETEESRDLAENALQAYSEVNDAIGCADSHRLLGLIAVDEGDGPGLKTALAAMINAATGFCPVRVIMAQAATGLGAALGNVAAGKAYWTAHFAAGSDGLHPAAACWVEEFLGIVANQDGDYVQAIRHWSKTYTLALASGQPRRARHAAGNIGDAFNKLNEYQTALEWMQRGLDLARKSKWPSMIGFSLTLTAETMRRLQRFDAAHELLSEALELMTAVAGSRYYATALHFLGDVELDRKQYANALATFRFLERRATVLNQADLLSNALRGQANALFRLGHPQQALKAAQGALTGAKLNAVDQIATLCVMAEIHVCHTLPAPPDMNAASIPLFYLTQALELATTIPGYIIPGDLLDAMADEYARLNDYVQAWKIGKQASAAREIKHQKEAANRANAMLVIHQMERSQAEEAHLRQLASEAKRAGILQQTSATLENLAKIGQEITAHLEVEPIFGVLNLHVHHLLDVNIFGISLMDEDGVTLSQSFVVEDGESVTQQRLNMYELESTFARFGPERREILIDQDPMQTDPNWPVGLLQTASRLFAPLYLGDKMLGWITVQSRKRNAYGSREQFIFRTLCAYAAIAIANAHALRALYKAQAQLVQQEKIASLADLVANFAHQLNTPIAAVKSSGKSITESLDHTLKSVPQLFQTLDAENQMLFVTLVDNTRTQTSLFSTREERAKVQALIPQLEASGIDNAQPKARILVQLGACTILNRILPLLKHIECDNILESAYQFAIISSNAANINTAADRMAKIISALKSFSGIEQLREKVPVHLYHGVEAALTMYQTQMQNRVEVVRDYADIPALYCLPDQINQVWANLIHNALQAMNFNGKLSIRIRQEQGKAIVAITDSGYGIDEMIRGRIFDAFFTTKNSGEGSGLGLAIVKMIIDRHHGRIDFGSGSNGGATFTVSLPYD
jgi:signal transduction histidine kinase/tetratricopeptide (TPR) repeat protein